MVHHGKTLAYWLMEEIKFHWLIRRNEYTTHKVTSDTGEK